MPDERRLYLIVVGADLVARDDWKCAANAGDVTFCSALDCTKFAAAAIKTIREDQPSPTQL